MSEFSGSMLTGLKMFIDTPGVRMLVQIHFIPIWIPAVKIINMQIDIIFIKLMINEKVSKMPSVLVQKLCSIYLKNEVLVACYIYYKNALNYIDWKDME